MAAKRGYTYPAPSSAQFNQQKILTDSQENGVKAIPVTDFAKSQYEIQQAESESDIVGVEIVGKKIKITGTKKANDFATPKDVKELNLYAVKNCVTEIKSGYIWNNENVLSANANYSAAIIEVEGGQDYSFNSKKFFASNFCLIIGTDGSVLGRFTTSYLKYAADGSYYATMPENAKYLHLSTGITSWDAVCLKGIVDLREKTLADYPIGEVKSVVGKAHFSFPDCDVQNVPKVFYCGSTREYTKLKDVVEEATKYENSIVYVDAETFDLVQEYGQSYLDGVAHRNAGYGLVLKNGIHLIFSSGSKVVFNYTGTNRIVFREFAVFNVGEGGFSIENADVESVNCRYTCHDDLGNSTKPYKNLFKNCRFKHDSTGTGSEWGAHAAIGGGLGGSSYICIEGGYYESIGNNDTISYHNDSSTTSASSKSFVSVSGAYLSGRFECANQGISTIKSKILVNNCSCGAAPHYSKSASYNDNIELITWNNTIRV